MGKSIDLDMGKPLGKYSAYSSKGFRIIFNLKKTLLSLLQKSQNQAHPCNQ